MLMHLRSLSALGGPLTNGFSLGVLLSTAALSLGCAALLRGARSEVRSGLTLFRRNPAHCLLESDERLLLRNEESPRSSPATSPCLERTRLRTTTPLQQLPSLQQPPSRQSSASPSPL
jgi:hypothetical protein